MNNNINHEIKTIVAELQSMSPRTQLEIVRLCKRVAELTPDYIETLSREDLAAFSALLEAAKTNLQNEIDAVDTRITTEVNAIDSELTEINNAIELLQTRINDCENDIDDEINDRVALINKNQTTNATNIVNESSDINIEAHGSVNITGYDEIYAQDDNGHSFAIDASGFALNTNDHNLTFKNNGKLEIDGNEVGGKKLYQHNITFINNFSNISYRLSFINDEESSFTNNQEVSYTAAIRNAICAAILALNPIPSGFTGINISVAGGTYQNGSNFKLPYECLIQSNNITCNYLNYSSNALSIGNESVSASYTINDQCAAL